MIRHMTYFLCSSLVNGAKKYNFPPTDNGIGRNGIGRIGGTTIWGALHLGALVK